MWSKMPQAVADWWIKFVLSLIDPAKDQERVFIELKLVQVSRLVRKQMDWKITKSFIRLLN